MLSRLRRRLGARGLAALLVGLAFLLTRALAIASTYAGAATISEEKRAVWQYRPGSLRPEQPPRVLEPLQRWDADFYANLALRGYPSGDHPRPVYALGFLPLYPLVVRAGTRLTGNVYWAAFILCNASDRHRGGARARFGSHAAAPAGGAAGHRRPRRVRALVRAHIRRRACLR